MRVVWCSFFKPWIQSLCSILEECNFHFTSDGLTISSLSSSQTACIECFLPSASFDQYEVSVPTTLGVSLPLLHSLLRLKTPTQQVVWIHENESTCTMQFIEQQHVQIAFDITLMHLEADRLEIPNDTTYDTVLTVTKAKTKYWYQALQQLKSTCQFIVRTDGFHILSSSDYTSIHLYNHDIPCSNTSSVDLTIGYNAFENAYQCSLLADKMEIRLKNDFPVCFHVQMDDHSYMTLHVAPVMGDE